MDYFGNSSRPLEVQSEWDRVVVEDVDSESWSEEGGEMVEFDRCGLDISEPLNVASLAISKSIETQEVDNLSIFLEDGQSRNHSSMSPWFQSKFPEFGSFMETLVEDLKELASNFLLVVEEKIRQRATKNALRKKTKGGGKGLRELRSLVSSINYDSASGKARGSKREKAVIVFQ